MYDMPLPLTNNVFNVLSILKEKVARRMRHVNSVGENIIGAPKIRDNYGAISSFSFIQYCYHLNIEKNDDNYCYRHSWKIDNYTESNIEKKP